MILADPPDILLTNYVMLELMLTRPRERSALITSAANLSFLVLDELHTYRGRQGADVAMLIRRLRGAIGTTALQCVGTSATLAGPGTKAEQRRQVAELATRIFGTPIPPDNIIGETLRRATAGDTDRRRTDRTPGLRYPDHLGGFAHRPAGDLGRADVRAARGRRGTAGPPTADPAAQPQQRPCHKNPVSTPGPARSSCAHCCWPAPRPATANGSPLFAFKLHQFIGKGDTVYVTLEPPETRYLTTHYQRSCPEGQPGQPLFPLAFCRECGQDFVVVNLDHGGQSFSPRMLNGGRGEQAEATGLLLPRRTSRGRHPTTLRCSTWCPTTG